MTTPENPTRALLPDPDSPRRWLAFESPVEVLETRSLARVPALISRVEEATRAGLTGIGFVSYEAAPAFDPALAVREPSPTPLAWFGLFAGPRRLELDLGSPGSEAGPGGLAPPADAWRPSLTAAEHAAAISKIRRHIALGDTYQVNFTFRLDAELGGAGALALFSVLVRSQSAPHSVFLDTPDWAICSVSPELFFRREHGTITCRPMKGTAPRGRTTREDRERARWLRTSAKNRAENVMIVDMVRNDLSKIGRAGSVRVSSLFDLERYDSVLQLTSAVRAESDASLERIFAALFPCASVTGAPKVRTMELIAELETRPRGIYTGAVGFAAPGGLASFNVAIRTVWIDRRAGRAVYGTGGGVVWDSSAEGEYEESRTKSLVLLEPRPRLSLLETLLWRPHRGYFLLRRHLARLSDSAAYFAMSIDAETARGRLLSLAEGLPSRPHRVRLLAGPAGDLRLEAEPLELDTRPWKVALARGPVDRDNRYLFHKTTWREPYDRARREHPELDDVILWNAEGEVTESTLANVVVELDGHRFTPPLDCGLLPGVLRAELLERGLVEERVVTPGDLARADRLYLINSVRGWVRAVLELGGPADGE